MIFSVIAINAIHIALQTVESISVPYSTIFYVIDNIIMGIFICEILLKWYSGFKIFWKDWWNILDFIVILVLHVSKKEIFLKKKNHKFDFIYFIASWVHGLHSSATLGCYEFCGLFAPFEA